MGFGPDNSQLGSHTGGCGTDNHYRNLKGDLNAPVTRCDVAFVATEEAVSSSYQTEGRVEMSHRTQAGTSFSHTDLLFFSFGLLC